MNKLIDYIRIWKHEFIYQLFYYNARKKSKNYKPIFLVGTPLHGNIGDQAITLAEYTYLTEKLNNDQVIIEIPAKYINMHIDRWQSLIGNNTILIQGGGLMGSLWPDEHNMIKKVIESYPDNHIVIFPQTVYYDVMSEEIDHFDKLLSKSTDITLCVRENASLEFARKYLPHSNPKLIPDMVTFFTSNMFRDEISTERKGVLLCMRNDKEKVIDDKKYNEIIHCITKYFAKENIIYTDTLLNRTVYPIHRDKVVREKISEFSNASLIITDRLHGMVLAAIANTPCIVLSNCNHKVKGVYGWIKNNQYIRYVEEINEFEKNVIDLIAIKNTHYSNELANDKFVELDKLVFKTQK